MTRAERYRQYAESARKRAAEASAKAHATLDQIEPGQPIITARGSRTTADINRRERAWANISKAAAEADKAQAWERRADRREQYDARVVRAQAEPSIEGVAIGDAVWGCFTNSYRNHRFPGVIVGRTVNSWKVRCLENFREWDGKPSEEVGRVFAIPALGKPTSSANNRVYKREVSNA